MECAEISTAVMESSSYCRAILKKCQLLHCGQSENNCYHGNGQNHLLRHSYFIWITLCCCGRTGIQSAYVLIYHLFYNLRYTGYITVPVRFERASHVRKCEKKNSIEGVIIRYCLIK